MLFIILNALPPSIQIPLNCIIANIEEKGKQNYFDL